MFLPPPLSHTENSQSQNKLNRKLLRHIVRKVLSGVSIILQAVHIRFELPAGGLDGAAPVKNSAGVGGGGACDAVGLMLPSLTVRTGLFPLPAFFGGGREYRNHHHLGTSYFGRGSFFLCLWGTVYPHGDYIEVRYNVGFLTRHLFLWPACWIFRGSRS